MPTTLPDEVRRIYMPYCIKQIDGGKYVILNRNYKPLGMATRDWVEYEPHAIKFKRLTKKTAAALSYKASEDLEFIYFYNDGCVPTDAEKHMKAYMARLAVLRSSSSSRRLNESADRPCRLLD